MTESHLPGWHYAEAERLLAQVGEMDPGLRVTQTFIARAQAHATLAQCQLLAVLREHGVERAR
ncbi:hypothetical protein [Mycobacterium marinum]|uniref:hypothetical protein n=1 Tax=Mycobacterium marinum TaxID=1781 RepID=UPI0002DD4BB4|nr:hypothetical protein [Mycobacterium marinum]